MCLINLALYHQYYAQDVIRLYSVTKFLRHLIQVSYYLLIALYGRLRVVKRQPALAQHVKAIVLLDLLHLI